MNSQQSNILDSGIAVKVEKSEESLFDNELSAQIIPNEVDEIQIKDEYFDEPESVIHEDVDIKSEDREGDQSNTSRFSEKEIKDEYSDGSQSMNYEEIYIKTEGDEEEDDDSNSGYEEKTAKEIKGNYSCDKCNYKARWKSHLISHMGVHDKDNATQYSCKRCSYQTINTSNIRRHLKKHGVFGRVCILCQESFDDKKSLDAHSIAQHPDRPSKYSCNHCSYRTVNNLDIKKHLKTHGGFGITCFLCQKLFNDKKCLDAHYVSKHPDRSDKWESMMTHKIIECPKCPYKTVITSNFKNHWTTHGTQTNQTGFKCKICGYKFVHKSHFNTHLRLHDGQLPFVCIKCDKSFNTKIQLDGHILSRHLGNEELMSSITSKLHECKKCDYKTVNHSNLKNHLKKSCL